MKFNMRILITSGGTRVAIDSVRSIVNFSSGAFGKRIATAGLLDGHSVTHLKSSQSPSPFEFKVDLYNGRGEDYASRLEELHTFSRKYMARYKCHIYDTYDDYAFKLEQLVMAYEYDAIILCAAVSDYKTDVERTGKISSKDGCVINLIPVPKLISSVQDWQPDARLVGFKLLAGATDEELIEAATTSLRNNKCYMVVANDFKDIQDTQKALYFIKNRTIPTDGTVISVASRIEGTSSEIAEKLIEAIR